MEMKEIYAAENYKVFNVTLNKGEKMPLHKASSNAFLICKKGKGRIIFSDREQYLSANETLLIKANVPHKMEIIEDFCSNIILDNDGKIDFLKPDGGQPAGMVY